MKALRIACSLIALISCLLLGYVLFINDIEPMWAVYLLSYITMAGLFGNAALAIIDLINEIKKKK